jgi:hypothetical protein
MSEKLASVPHRSVLERAGEALLTTARQLRGTLAAPAGRADEVSISALARAIAFPQPARLEQLASAVQGGTYFVPHSDLSRSLVSEHLLTF